MHLMEFRQEVLAQVFKDKTYITEHCYFMTVNQLDWWILNFFSLLSIPNIPTSPSIQNM